MTLSNTILINREHRRECEAVTMTDWSGLFEDNISIYHPSNHGLALTLFALILYNQAGIAPLTS